MKKRTEKVSKDKGVEEEPPLTAGGVMGLIFNLSPLFSLQVCFVLKPLYNTDLFIQVMIFTNKYA